MPFCANLIALCHPRDRRADECTLQAWFYELQASGGQLLAEHDYLGSVEAMHLNDQWAAAIFEGMHHLVTMIG